MKPKFTPLLAATLLLSLATVTRAIELKDVAAKIDPATGKAADTATEFAVEGVVAARATLADGTVLAVLQEEGSALPVLLTKDTKIKPRDAVSLTGKLADHPLGLAVLQTTKEAVSGSGKTLKPTAHSLDELKDASALVAEYVVLTNVTFAAAAPKFAAGKTVPVKDAAGTEAKILVGQSLDGRDIPAGPQNLFGVPLKTSEGWVVLPARFVPAESAKVRALAMKHTCMSCHQLDKKVVGPSYLDVATRYRNDADLLAKITAQIENGGTGKWGAVPMVGFKGKVPPEDIQKLAQWIADMRWDAVLGE